jgi:hypothetical protein
MNFKRGDTFRMVGFLGTSASKIDLTGYAIRSQLRGLYGALIAEFAVTVDLVNRTFSMSETAARTTLWPVGAVVCDVQFVDTLGDTRSTQTFNLDIIEDVTQ